MQRIEEPDDAPLFKTNALGAFRPLDQRAIVTKRVIQLLNGGAAPRKIRVGGRDSSWRLAGLHNGLIAERIFWVRITILQSQILSVVVFGTIDTQFLCI